MDPLFEIKASPEGVISGYGSVYGVIDSYNERVMPGAYEASLAKRQPVMLWQHDHERPIGKWTRAAPDCKGLFVEGQLNLKTTAGRDAFEHVRAGDVNGLSIGYREIKARTGEDGTRELLELDLREVSVVTFPANIAATVIGSKAELIDRLHATGLSKRAAAAVAERGYAALSKTEEANPDVMRELMKALDASTAQLKIDPAEKHSPGFRW